MFLRVCTFTGLLPALCCFALGCSGDDGDTNSTHEMEGTGGFSAGSGGALATGGMTPTGSGGMAPGSGGVVGSGGAVGTGGDVGTGGTVGTGGAPPVDGDLGVGDGSDVILIGDSWMNLGTVGIQQSLVAVSGQPYRQLGVPGTRMLDEVIPNQYAAAKAMNPDIKTVVMTGGGNDVLQNPGVLLDCFSVGPSCKQQIDLVGQRYQVLAEEAAADGVQDVVIIVYSRGTALGAPVIEYVWETLGPICENSPVNCYMVDPDEVAGQTMTMRDGIHPTDEGYNLIAEHVYQLMQDEGMRR